MSFRAVFCGFVHNIVIRNRVALVLPSSNSHAKFLTSQTNQSNNSEDQNKKKQKKPPVPKITLISGENVSVVTLEEAQKLSKRRDLKLVKIVDLDTKSQRPVYKLMSGAEYHSEDLRQREERKKERLNSNALKGEKVVLLNCNISEHDLLVYVNKTVKWIAKKYEVRYVINGSSSMEKAEQVYKFLEEKLKNDVRIVQKRIQGNDIKFQMIPPKKDKDHLDAS